MRTLQPETIILVHGTFANSKAHDQLQWWEPGSEFCNDLNERLIRLGSPARCWAHVDAKHNIKHEYDVIQCGFIPSKKFSKKDRLLHDFEWSGLNSWVARFDAASRLAQYIEGLRSEGWRCHIIAHSHGGNILIDAIDSLSPLGIGDWTSGNLITMGTPFLNSFRRSRVRHLCLPEVILSLLVIATAWMASDFIKFPLFAPSTSSWVVAAIVTLFLALLSVAISAGYLVGMGTSRYFDESDRLLVISSESDEAYQLLSNVINIQNPFLQTTGNASLKTSFEWFHRISKISLRADRVRFPDSCQILPATFVVLLLTLMSIKDIVPSVLIQPLWCLTLISIGGFLLCGVFLFKPTIAVVCIPFRIARFFFDIIKSMVLKFGMWIMRRNIWEFFKRMALGLADYPFTSNVSQTPNDVPSQFYSHILLSEHVVKETLKRQLKSVTKMHTVLREALARPQLSLTDLENLLAEVAMDTELVHAAYYTTPECLEQLAAWIARTEEEVQRLQKERMQRLYDEMSNLLEEEENETKNSVGKSGMDSQRDQ